LTQLGNARVSRFGDMAATALELLNRKLEAKQKAATLT
jgi:hypothetical protein